MAGVILDWDLGNTRYKWRLQRDGVTVKEGAGVHSEGLPASSEIGSIDRMRVACVAGDVILDSFVEQMREYRVRPEVAASGFHAAGVTNAYGEDYKKLGVDRWLSVVAGFRRVRGAVLVLDAGSALTADLVDEEGVHLGGYIVPGVQMMKSSLFNQTGQVRFESEDLAGHLDFGCSTQEAVDAGVLAAQVGAACTAIEEAGRRIPKGFAILVTGGCGSMLVKYLPERAELVPDLVLDGLNWVLP